MDKRNLSIRSATGFIFAIVMIAGMVINQFSFCLLTTLICAGCLWEYYSLISTMLTYRNRAKIIMKATYFLAGMLIYSLLVMSEFSIIGFQKNALIIFPVVCVLMTIEMFTGATRHFQNTAFNLLGLIYIVIPISLLHYSTLDELIWFPGKVNPVFGLLLLIWSNDTFAYLAGSQFGKHKIFPAISPKKSWEGFAAGFVASTLTGILISNWFQGLTLTNWIVLAIIASVCGTAGDLFESMIKRNIGVKDSGKLLPGHGGLLDRFDAFLFCIPFLFAYLKSL